MGIGGEYPLSATVTSENSEGADRGRNVSSVFAMQGVGNVLSSVVMYGLLASGLKLDYVWRIAVAFGAVPGLCTVYFRWQMGESKHFQKMQRMDRKLEQENSEHATLLAAPVLNPVAEDEEITPGVYGGAPARMNSSDAVKILGPVRSEGSTQVADEEPIHTGLRRTLDTIYEFRWVLLGTAGSWFIFDITFYANGLFSGSILEAVGIAGHSEPGEGPTQHQLAQIALTNIIITTIGLPGYICAVLCIDSVGRRNLQLIGFTMVAIVFVFMAAFLEPLEGNIKWLFVGLYGLTFFFANFGPNTTTFVIPSESFPTRARATCHGLSAASGKMGAVVGGAALRPLMAAYGTVSAHDKNRGLALVLFVCAGVSLLGTVWTWFFTVDQGGNNLAELDKQSESATPRGEAAFEALLTPVGFSIPDISGGDSVRSEDMGDSGSVRSGTSSKKYGVRGRTVNTPEGERPLLSAGASGGVSPQFVPSNPRAGGASALPASPLGRPQSVDSSGFKGSSLP